MNMAESIKLMDSKMESRKEGQKAFFKAGGTVRSANFSKVENYCFHFVNKIDVNSICIL